MKRFPFHTLLLGLYPVVALLAHNITQVRVSDAFTSLALTLVASLLLLVALAWVMKDWQKAGLIVTLLLLFFFSYGHIYNYLQTISVAGFSPGRHRFFAPLWFGLLAGGIFWIARRVRNTDTITLALNAAGLVAMIFPLIQIGVYQARAVQASSTTMTGSERSGLRLPAGTPPDIYYIVLDSYARDDVLRQEYKLDNRPFLDELAGMGFYVAACSQSNYAQTVLSLASTLNMDYLDALDAIPGTNSEDRSRAVSLLRDSLVRNSLEELGYRIVAFDSGFYQTQWENADVYLSYQNRAVGGVNGFEALLVKNSAALLLTDAAALLPNQLVPDVNYPHKLHRQSILYTFDALASLPEEIPGPKFVFVHLVAPHEPFVFGPDGEEVLISEDAQGSVYAAGYRDQVIYLNKRLIPLVQTLIDRSATPPIILLQADHGTGRASNSKRMAILNAYYLPGEGSQLLYESISPVNTFRVILNAYFGGNYPLLEDRAYFSSYQAPYNFRLISNQREGCPR